MDIEKGYPMVALFLLYRKLRTVFVTFRRNTLQKA